MKAVVYDRYGPADVVRVEEIAQPEPGPGEILVRVRAASVSTADWRIRAAAFPGVLAVPGRLMFGIVRPRNRVLGADFAGEVASVGAGVAGVSAGDRVFGFSGTGAHAEYLTMKADGPVAPIPDGLTFEEAAALPFGALSAIVFLRDFARVKPGERVLVVGASGAVGAYATQIATAFGAEVTGVAGADRKSLVEGFGARHLDYRAHPVPGAGPWDVILDTVGVVSSSAALDALARGGRFVPLNFGVGDMGRALVTRLFGSKRILIGVSGDSADDLRVLSEMVAEGKLRPVVDRVYPMTEVRAAYRHVESRHKAGSVVLSMEGALGQRSAA